MQNYMNSKSKPLFTLIKKTRLHGAMKSACSNTEYYKEGIKNVQTVVEECLRCNILKSVWTLSFSCFTICSPQTGFKNRIRYLSRYKPARNQLISYVT